MAKHFHRGRPDGQDRRRGGPSLGPRGDRLWLHGVHPVLAALGNPDRGLRRLLLTAEQAERLKDRLQGALAARNGQPKPEIVDRRALDDLLKGTVHQGIAVEWAEAGVAREVLVARRTAVHRRLNGRAK